MEWQNVLPGDCTFVRGRDASEIYLYTEADDALFDALLCAARAAGFSKEDEWAAGIRFVTFRKERLHLFLSYSACDHRASFVCREQASLPASREANVCTPLLTQVHQPYYCSDCGMSYLLRTGAGRFIVIDGGEGKFEYAEETAHLLELLRAQNPLEGKPEIVAWFISHTHNDHAGVLLDYLENYAETCRLDCVIFNAAPDDRTVPSGVKSDPALLERALATANVPHFVPSAGQRLRLDDVSFEILYTWEDYVPAFISYFNDTSLVMTARAGRYRVFFPGDAMPPAAELLCRRYDRAFFACDILQVAHHGYWGANAEFYDAVNASTLLWPCPDFQYLRLRDAKNNRNLVTDRNRERVFFAWRDDAVLDLTRPIPAAKQDEPVPVGGCLRDERFDKNLFETRLGCLTCGGSGYCAPIPRVEPGKLHLQASDDAYAVLELAIPAHMKAMRAFTLTLEGVVDAAQEPFGFFVDYDSPMTMDESRADWFTPAPGAFCWRLTRTADGLIRLFDGEKTLFQRAAGPQEGLYLIFRHALLTLTRLSITRDA